MSKEKTFEENVKDFRKVHGDTYDYIEEVETRRKKGKIERYVKALCRKHDSFVISVRSHKQGGGCPKCSGEVRGAKLTKTFEENIIDFRRVHKDRYEYPEKTKRAKDKFNVFCPVENHGLFPITTDNHKRGKGCPKCSRESKQNLNFADWGRNAEDSKYFDSFKVYIIECYNENEQFIKIR